MQRDSAGEGGRRAQGRRPPGGPWWLVVPLAVTTLGLPAVLDVVGLHLPAATVGLAGALAVALVGGLLVHSRTRQRRAAAEEELRRSRSFLDSVVENIPVMVFVKDAVDLRFVRFNRAGEELLGYSRDELVGRSDADFFPSEEAEFFLAKDREVLDRRRLVDIPAERIQTRDRGERVLHTRKIPILDDDGTPRYLLGVSEDITERQQADAALEEARLAAQRANQAKNQFLSRMSHELRTPLNAVLGFGQLLQLDELTPDQRESVRHIVHAGSHLLELIDEVLDISRVESGQLRLSLEPVSLDDVVAEALGMVGPLAAARGMRMRDEWPCGAGTHVRADRQRLRQVMVNLLANAVKYNRDDGEVTVRCEDTGTGCMRLVVADTGIGLTEHDVTRLFQPFERLGAEQAGIEGTGLGLVLTKQLVEVMGGVVGVTSEVGVGSSFWVELPVADGPPEAPSRVDVAVQPSATGGDAARTVLYVEDNPSNVKLVERVVARRPGVDFIVAMQGSLALEMARQHRPSLVLLDLHLPDMSGEEVLQRLRADPRTAATPVVVLSADATAGQVERLRASGAADYLTKPFDILRLLAVIDGIAAPGAGDTPSPPAAAHGDGHLDATTVAALVDLGGGDGGAGAAGLRDAVGTYLDDGAARLAGLRAAVAGGDAGATERLAHSLAGSSAAFGARRVAEGCRALERTARAGDLGGAASLLSRVEADFAAAATALRRRFLHGDGGPT